MACASCLDGHLDDVASGVTQAHPGADRVSAVTVSLGVASMPTHDLSGKELVAAADAAMYPARGR